MTKPRRFPLSGNNTIRVLSPFYHWDIDHHKIRIHHSAQLPLKKLPIKLGQSRQIDQRAYKAIQLYNKKTSKDSIDFNEQSDHKVTIHNIPTNTPPNYIELIPIM